MNKRLDSRHTLAGGLVAQWITRLTTDQKIPGSNPGELDNFFYRLLISIWYFHTILTLILTLTL